LQYKQKFKDDMAAITQSAHVIVDDFIAPVCHEQIEIIYQDDDILLSINLAVC
jgi:23S rRNA-/tRNA-specific pseudouridylate synthase